MPAGQGKFVYKQGHPWHRKKQKHRNVAQPYCLYPKIGFYLSLRCGRKAREVRTSTSYPTVHLRFDIHASSLLGEIKPPLIASRQAHPPMPSSLEAPSSNGEAPDQKRRGQRKTTQPAASNRLMGLLRRYTRVRIHPNRVLLRPAPMSSSHCFALAKRSCGMRLADTTGSG